MTPRLCLALLLASALAGPCPAQDYSKKDLERAAQYAEEDQDFQAMPDALKAKLRDEMIEMIAAKLHGHKPKYVKNVDIVYQKGDTVQKLAGKSYAKGKAPEAVRFNGKTYQVVELNEDIPEIPATPWTNMPIPLPSFGSLFKDNEYQVRGSLDQKTLDVIAATKANIEKSGGRAKLTGIMIKASASTLKNTEGAAAMTHYDLSLERADSAREVILGLLGDAAKGLTKDDIQINADGQNYSKDDPQTAINRGTSGPGSPHPCPAGTPENLCPTGDDEKFDQLCAGTFVDTKADEDEVSAEDAQKDPWDWGEVTAVDCKDWKTVKDLRSIPSSQWTSEDKAAVKRFYDPFKYVSVRLNVIRQTGTAGQKGEAHMVLALVETSNGRTTIKRKHHFKATKVKRRKPSREDRARIKLVRNSCHPKKPRLNRHGTRR